MFLYRRFLQIVNRFVDVLLAIVRIDLLCSRTFG